MKWIELVSGNNLWPAVQGVGSILAILSGFASVVVQRRCAERAAAKAAYQLARHAMTLLAERFDAAIPQPPASMGFLLRGNRATEMIEVMRELDISLLPAKQIPVVASIRSGVYAVNARIHDVFLAEEADPTLSQSRRSELKSAGMVFRQTQDDLKAFGSSLYGRRKKIRPVPIEKNLKDYLQSIPTSPSANSPPSP